MSRIKTYSSIFVGISGAVMLFIGVSGNSATAPIPTVAGHTYPANSIRGAAAEPSVLAQTTETATSLQETPPATPSPPTPPKPAPMPSITKRTTPTPKPATKPTPAPAPACDGSVTQQFFCLLNQYRASKGMKAISQNNGLANVALTHSQWMNTTGIFSHTGINGSRLGDRCKTAGITCRGENLAEGAKSAQNLLDMWKASAGHNKNLLGTYSSGGLGISGSYTTLLLN